MKKWEMLLAFSLTACVLTGCTSFKSDVNAVKLSKGGSVQAAVIESLDKAYYDETELQTSVDESVAEYNGSHEEDSIKVKEFEVKDDIATLYMDYATSADYQEFNHVVFYAGDLQGAYDAGYEFPENFHQVEKGDVTGTVTKSDILSGLNYSVLIYSEEMEVQVPGSILYTSQEAVVEGKNKATNADVKEAEQTEETAKQTEAETSEGDTLKPTEEEVLTGEETAVAAGNQTTYTFIIYN